MNAISYVSLSLSFSFSFSCHFADNLTGLFWAVFLNTMYNSSTVVTRLKHQ